MLKFMIKFTDDFGKTYHSATVSAENKTKAYIEAYVVLPLSVAIVEVKQV
jgi:hypothetical protein